MTQERLKEELNMRRNELDKIDTLEDKIKTELAQLAERSEQMREQVATFQNVGDLKGKAESTRARLEAVRGALLKRRDLLRAVVADKALKAQARKAQLSENNVQVEQCGTCASCAWSREGAAGLWCGGVCVCVCDLHAPWQEGHGRCWCTRARAAQQQLMAAAGAGTHP